MSLHPHNIEQKTEVTLPSTSYRKRSTIRFPQAKHPAKNNFLLAREFSVTGAFYTRRPDFVGFVNPDSIQSWWSSS